MGGPALRAKVRYDQCPRFAAPLMAVLLVTAGAFLSVGATLA